MSNFYDLNEIKTAIRNDIEKHEAFLHAWENVSFPTKKDGSAFKQMQKNKKTIAAHKKQLAVATIAYNAFAEQFKKAANELAKNTDKSENSTLYNAIFDTVTKRYPYI